jgi:hypothetical protein
VSARTSHIQVKTAKEIIGCFGTKRQSFDDVTFVCCVVLVIAVRVGIFDDLLVLQWEVMLKSILIPGISELQAKICPRLNWWRQLHA